MDVHIGQLIKKLCWERHLTTAALAKELGISRQAVYGLFRRKDLHTSWFVPLAKTLEYDFAQHYLNEENKQRLEQGDDEAEALKQENEALKEKVEMLEKMVKLLEKS